MSHPLRCPDDDTLRGYLLGTLPATRAEEVRAWLDSDARNADLLERLSVRDPLTDTFSENMLGDSVPAETIARIVRNVSESILRDSSAVISSAQSDTVDIPAGAAEPLGQSAVLPRVWPPVRLGGYRIVRELGHGGMGYVFEAEDETLARRVAIKVLRPELLIRREARPRFLREARAAARVEHDNVVPILHVGDDAGTSYIVMPLLKGESLSTRLKRAGKMTAPEVVRLGREVAAGLAAAHATGLVHRDMKPANIWLDEGTNRARVLDFGLARLSDGGDALTDSGALAGTPAFMAPEVIDGKPATVQSDFFSLGAVLYECATGKNAFDGPTVTAILKAVTCNNPPSPGELNPSVPASLSVAIVRMLEKDPARRPADAAEIAASLAGEEVDGSPTVTWHDRLEPVKRDGKAKRRRAWIAAAVVAFAALAGVAAWQGTRSKPIDVARHETPNEQPGPATLASTTPETTTPKLALPAASANPAPVKQDTPIALTNYRGRIDLRVKRAVDGRPQLLRLNQFSALPLKQTDEFRIEAEVEPPAYVYIIWVDPGHDVTPVYPWDGSLDNPWGSRPPKEEPVSRVSLPPNADNLYRAPKAKPGVATMVMFARTTPLDVPDEVVRKWFEELPELPLPPPPGGDSAAVWFDNFVEVQETERLRTFDVTGSNNAFAQWQGKLQQSLKGRIAFETAVSFARTGAK